MKQICEQKHELYKLCVIKQLLVEYYIKGKQFYNQMVIVIVNNDLDIWQRKCKYNAHS